MADTYIKGNVMRWTASFSVANPTTVTFIVKKPDGSTTTYTHGTDPEVVKDSPTQYHLDTPLDQPNRWKVRALATGNGASADEDQINVKSFA